MIQSKRIQACVANFELYLQDFLYEHIDIVRQEPREKRPKLPSQREPRTPNWLDVVHGFEQIGIDLEVSDVTGPREIRHGLAHRLTTERNNITGRRRPLEAFRTGESPFGHGSTILTTDVFQENVRTPLARTGCRMEGLRAAALDDVTQSS